MAKKRIGGRVVYVRKDGTYKGQDSATATSPKASWYESQDVSGLTQEQIDKINLARSDVWRNAKQYIEETKEVKEPKLTKRQNELWYKAKDGDFEALKSAKPETVKAVLSQAEFEYYRTQKMLARGDYLVEDDLPSNMRGYRNNFGTYYSLRQQYARIVNEIYEIYEPHAKKPRGITSLAYKQSQSRLNKQINDRFKNRR